MYEQASSQAAGLKIVGARISPIDYPSDFRRPGLSHVEPVSLTASLHARLKASLLILKRWSASSISCAFGVGLSGSAFISSINHARHSFSPLIVPIRLKLSGGWIRTL